MTLNLTSTSFCPALHLGSQSSVSALIKHRVLSAGWLDGNSLMKSSANPCDSPRNLGGWYSQHSESMFGVKLSFLRFSCSSPQSLVAAFGAPSSKSCPSPSHTVHQGCQALLSQHRLGMLLPGSLRLTLLLVPSPE